MAWRGSGVFLSFRMAVVCGVMVHSSGLVYAQHFPEPDSEAKPVVKSRTSIIPSLRVAERYDSNVYFVPGTNLEDYVTTVSPQLTLTRENRWVKASMSGGATAETYVKNPGLNYVGGNGTLDLNLDGVTNGLVRGLGLRVVDSISYTPQPPAFAAPIGGSQISEAFVQGIQARRANAFTNIGIVQADYFFAPFMGVTSTYTNRRIRFGKPIVAPNEEVTQGGFRNTSFQTLTSGLVVRPSLSDTMSVLHQYQKSDIHDPDRGASGFSTQGAIARWSRSITPTLQATVEGGFSVISTTSNVYPVGTASLEWQGQYTSMEVSYSRAITPSLFTISTPLLSQMVTGTIRRHIMEPLSVSLSGSYAVNQSVPDDSVIRFASYSVTPSLEYQIGPRLRVTLTYRRSEFKREIFGRASDFDRNTVMLNLLVEWR